MTTAPDPAEITPPKDPAAYARPRGGLGLAGWAILVLCLICIVVGFGLSRVVPAAWIGRADTVETSPAGTAAALATLPATPAPAAIQTPDTLPQAAAGSAELVALQARVEALETGQTRTVNAAAAALAADFNNVAAKAAVAARDPGERGSFLARISHALSAIVTIRRVDGGAGDSPDAVLARAGDAVAEGDIEEALKTLRGLPPQAAAAMAPWRARAQQRIAVDRQVAAVRALALSDLMAVSREGS